MYFKHLYYITLFLGQFLVRTSCSFFLVSIFWQWQTTPRHDQHLDAHLNNETGWAPALWESTPVDKSLVDKELQLMLDGMQHITDHQAPFLSNSDAKKKYAELCSIYTKQCKNTLREGVYDRSEKYMFQWLSIVLLQQLDNRLVNKQKIQHQLVQLKFYQDDEDRRGSAGHTTVKINSKKIPTTREFREVLTHELWHIVDLSVLQGSSRKKDPDFTEFGKIMRAIDDPSMDFYRISRISENSRTAEASFKDFVSGYAMKGLYEDFAETQNLRFNHNLLFQELANNNDMLAKKYAFFKNIYNNKRYDDNAKSVALVSISKRPRDTTRIQ